MQSEAERVMPEQPPVEIITVQSAAGAAEITTEQQNLHIRQKDSFGKVLAKLMFFWS